MPVVYKIGPRDKRNLCVLSFQAAWIGYGVTPRRAVETPWVVEKALPLDLKIDFGELTLGATKLRADAILRSFGFEDVKVSA